MKKLIKYLIKKFLPGYHLHKTPTTKKHDPTKRAAAVGVIFNKN